MSLRAHECRERARDARALARSALTISVWTACEQTSDYWLALAERLEHEPRQPIRVAPSPSSSQTVYPDTMPLLGYFICVGVALLLGLAALNAYVDRGGPDGAPGMSTDTTVAVLAPGLIKPADET